MPEFDLWLRLQNPTTREAARAQLAAEIADPEKTMHRVRLALAYDVPFNREALERHLAAQKQFGGWTADERHAAFLLVYHSADPARIGAFFDTYHDDLFNQTDLAYGALAGIEIEVFARAGRLEDARRHISQHRQSGHLTDEQAQQLQEIVGHVEKGDEVESLRHRYIESQSLIDLRILIAALRNRRDFNQLADYAPRLARATKASEDFGLAVRSLFDRRRYGELIALTEELPELQSLDDDYAAAHGWALAEVGRVLEARDIARQLLARRDVASDRELAVMTAVETGDWGNLQAIVAREASRAETLPPRDLMRLARLALEAGSPYIDQFRDAALRKAPDDPEINLLAYTLAIERGAEYQGSQAHTWLQKAIAQSGAEGPVRFVSIRELVEQAPTWNKHRENVDQMLRRGDVPVFIAAKAVRRQVFDLTLGQALRNSDPTDKRIRYPVLAFSGAQPERDIADAKSVALDITAIATLDFLGLLEETLARFDQIVIAPKTLSMPFLERQFLKFHQPSQMTKALRLQALIGAGRLKLISSEVDQPSGLAKEIGPELATLLVAAQREGGLVVRSAPVFKLGSFLEERADMSPHAAVLTDTLTTVSFLSGAGKLDLERKERAETYLKQVDPGWATPQTISRGSKLYLDDLTVNYLDHVGLLEILTNSVAAVFVHRDLDSKTRNLLHYGKHTEDLLATIERIRSVITAKVETGRIRFCARHLRDTSGDEEKDDILESAPTLDLLSDLSGIEVVVADDRCLNKLPTWIDASGRSALATSSLSVLAALRTGGQLSNRAYWRARHKLRIAAYYAVPVEVDELIEHLANASIVNGEVRETPELRAIRESISLPRINDVFVPWEEPWLNRVRYAAYKAIHETWLRSADLDQARAEADWLWTILPNPLEWCLSPDIETVWAAARQQLAIQVAFMLILIEASDERRNRYFAWLQDTVVRALEHGHPEIWKSTLEFLKSYLVKLIDSRGGDAVPLREGLFALILESLPAKVRTDLLLDESFAAKFNFTPRFLLPFGDAGPVYATSLNNALRAAVAGRKTALLVPERGKPFRLQLGLNTGGQATIQFKGREFAFNDADLLSRDAQARSKALKRVFAAKPLTPAEEDSWRVIARERTFTDREFLLLMTALEATPEALHKRAQMPRPLDIGGILPEEGQYFDRLLAPLGDAPDLRSFIDFELIKNGGRRIRRHRKATLRRLAYAALWRPLIPFDLLGPIITLSDVELLLNASDPFSLLFAFELCCKFLQTNEAFLRLGTQLLEKLFDPVASMRRCYVFSAIVHMTVTNLRQAAKLPDAPLFWTRLTALTHAGVVTDALGERDDAEELFHWATEHFYPTYRWHTIIDRREAPRWRPDWISPDHLHAEIVGRVAQALQAVSPAQRPQAWASDFEAALGELAKTGKALSASFPGPFDDFQRSTAPAEVPPLFKAINEALEKASNFSDVSNLFAFAYSVPLPEPAVAAVLRILSLPLDESITNDKDDVPFLHLSAYIAGAARSEPIATAVINRCLFAVRNATSDDEIPRFLSIAIEACAANEKADKYRASIGSVATQICFAAPDNAYLSELETIFDVLALRDETLIPAFARARAIVRTRLRAA